MSDWIMHDGKRYFEEGYLKGATALAAARGVDSARIDALAVYLHEHHELTIQESVNGGYYAGPHGDYLGQVTLREALDKLVEASKADPPEPQPPLSQPPPWEAEIP